MSQPILYSFRRCPYAMRARCALLIANIQCQIREVNLKNKPEALLTASPKGTVPVLVLDDGTVIDESLDIIDWALSQHDPENWLGSSLTAKALWSKFEQNVLDHMIRYKYPDRFAGESIDIESERAICQDFFATIDAHIASKQGAYLNGSMRSLIDIVIFPHIRQAARVDLDWFVNLPMPNLVQWYHLIADSPLFKTVMHNYPVWDATQTPVYFPPAQTG